MGRGRWIRRLLGPGLVSVAVTAAALAAPAGAAASRPIVRGKLLSGSQPVPRTCVRLYLSAARAGGRATVLGRAISRADGSFAIAYRRRPRSSRVLYVIAGRPDAVRLAAVLGAGARSGRVVVNERTTVAAGFALAQFVDGPWIGGRDPGPQNAAAMSHNLADVRTGRVAPVLASKPNGGQTSTLRTFNSLANALVPCVRSKRACAALFAAAKPRGGRLPRGTLEAVADIARNPAHNVRKLFELTRARSATYTPALGPGSVPDAWTLALRFDGNGRTLSGPGNMAIDARGNVWVTANYVYSPNPLAPVCGSPLIFKFTPSGRSAPGSPYTGGGLSGVGFGITLDPHGNVWAGNFGFASTKCQQQPPHDSVSEFAPSGAALSPSADAQSSGGFTKGPISWPQGTVSDRRGNIWIANCGNGTITRYANGNPNAARTFDRTGLEKPFDIAFNGRGDAFVTGNANSTVAILSPGGAPTPRSPITGGGITRPLGIAADSRGNMWVANSGVIAIPCPDADASAPTGAASITLIGSNGAPHSRPFKGGGLTIPWGIAVDGNDDVWVANFGKQRLSEFCGVDTAGCPVGMHTGQPISPRSGYSFDGLSRNTGVQIDPSGNVWVANNWKNLPIPSLNPGGYQIVAFIGLAGPLHTPLIGPPRAP